MRGRKRHLRSKSRLGRSQSNFENLESRLLLAYTWISEVADTGNAVTNGKNFEAVLESDAGHLVNGHYLQYGDTIVLAAGASYQAPAWTTKWGQGGFLMPYRSGTGTITIESSVIWNTTNHDGAGTNLAPNVRVSGAVASSMPKLITPGSNSPILRTVLKDTDGNNVTTGPHDYTILGVEMSPQNPGDDFFGLVLLGEGSAAQNSSASEAHDINIDRCYIHGLDPVGPGYSQYAALQHGIVINSRNTIVKNSEISKIASDTPDSNAIGGYNSSGNVTITNNLVQGSSECLIFGGGAKNISTVMTNVLINKNTFSKPLYWNSTDPSYYTGPCNGVPWSVKNMMEFKEGDSVTIDQNLFMNGWNTGDQVGTGLLIAAKNSGNNNDWIYTRHFTVTNNVFRNIGEGIRIGTNPKTDGGNTCLPAADITIRNNVFEGITGEHGGTGDGIMLPRGDEPMTGPLIIDHNVFYDSHAAIAFDGGKNSNYVTFCTDNVQITNNIFGYGKYGIRSSVATNAGAFNTFFSGIDMTNQGAGYSTTPTVTFSGGGAATQAKGTPIIKDYKVVGIMITDPGSGYTSAPTITISGGSPTTPATAIVVPGGITNGGIGVWTCRSNIFYGTSASDLPDAANNYTAASMDAAFIQDPAGELNGSVISNASYHSIGYNAAYGALDGNYYAHIGPNTATLAPDFVPVDSTLRNYWKFDEGSGTTSYDIKGTKNLTLAAGASIVTGGNSYNAMSQNGSGYASATSFTPTSTFSFAAWIKITANNVLQYIASTGTGNSAFSLYVKSNNMLAATTSNVTEIADTTALSTNTWYLVGCTYDDASKTLRIFKNGQQVGSRTGTGNVSVTAATLYLGDKGGTASSFKGMIDEARYYTGDMSKVTFNGLSGMKHLYDNYGPLFNSVTTPADSANPLTKSKPQMGYGGVVSHGSNATFTYTWSVYSYNGVIGNTGGATFTNGTSTSPTACTVNWANAGRYVLQLSVSDSNGGVHTAYYGTYIRQVPTTSSISPLNPAVGTNGTINFTYTSSNIDQFSHTIASSQYAWAVSSATGSSIKGTINKTTGAYIAPSAAATDTVKFLCDGGVVKSTNVTVTGGKVVSIATTSNATEAGPGSGVFTITSSVAPTSNMIVYYHVDTASTASSADYTQTLTGQATILANQTSTTITITPVQDGQVEFTENLKLVLDPNGTLYGIGTSNATMTITNNDKPSVKIVATSPNASEAGPTNGVFTVTRYGSGPALYSGAMTVNYQIQTGGSNAINGTDYSTIPTSITLADGAASKTITVAVINDQIVEGPETVILTVSSGTGYTVGSPSSATVNIADDDNGLIAYEGFNYSTGSGAPGPLNGASGGTGWAAGSNWSVTGSGEYSYVDSGSMGYSYNGYLLTTSGNTGALWNGGGYGDATRSFSDPGWGVSGTTRWVSFLMMQHRSSGSNALFGRLILDTNLVLCQGVGGQYSMSAFGVNSTGSGSVIQPDKTVFVVARIDFGDTVSVADKIYLWANNYGETNDSLKPCIEPDIASASVLTLNVAGGKYLPRTSTPQIVLHQEQGNVKVSWDEIRIGKTYGDAAPDDYVGNSVSVEATTASANEAGPANGVFTISTDTAPTSDMIVNYTMSGTAANGTDYVTLSGTATIAANTTSTTVNLTPIDNNSITGQLNAMMTIASGTGYTPSTSDASATVYIADADLPTVSIVATNPNAYEDGSGNGTFTITRSGDGPALTTGDLPISFSISGTAVNGTDYTLVLPTLSILSGQTSTTISVAPIDNGVAEATLTATVQVYSVSGSYNADSNNDTDTVNILDCDSQVTVTATDSSAAEDGASGPDSGTFTISRTGPADVATTVNYTVTGTATAGTDYQALAGSVTFDVGQSSTTVTVAPLRDDVLESGETVILTIGASTGNNYYTVGTPSSDTVNIADNGLIAYEGFNYTTGSGSPGPLSGASGGVGFSNAWSVVGSGEYSYVDAGNLGYSYNGHALLSAGNTGALWNGAGYGDATRNISDPTWGTSGTSRWIAFIMNQHRTSGSPSLFCRVVIDSNLTLCTSYMNGGVAYYGASCFSKTSINGSTAAKTVDVPVFAVARIDFGDTTTIPDKIYFWANNQGGSSQSLTPGTIPSDAVASVLTLNVGGGEYLPRTTTPQLLLHQEQGNVKGSWDEIRIGTSYFSVAPDPIVVQDGDRRGKGHRNDPLLPGSDLVPVPAASTRAEAVVAKLLAVNEPMPAPQAATATSYESIGLTSDPNIDVSRPLAARMTRILTTDIFTARPSVGISTSNDLQGSVLDSGLLKDDLLDMLRPIEIK